MYKRQLYRLKDRGANEAISSLYSTLNKIWIGTEIEYQSFMRRLNYPVFAQKPFSDTFRLSGTGPSVNQEVGVVVIEFEPGLPDS